MGEARFRTLGELVELLVDERGLVCDDPKRLERFLLVNNYRHVAGYARQFQIDPEHGDDRFEPGTSFEKVRLMMDLDQRLSDLVLSGLSTVEKAMRSLFAHEFGAAYGAGAFYLNDDFYDYGTMAGSENRLDVPLSLARDLDRQSPGSVIKRYRTPSVHGTDAQSLLRRYREVPIWVAVEAISFGHLSMMIRNCRDIGPCKRMAADISVQWADFSSVIRSFVVLRNLCAHQRRLWQRNLGIQCPVQRKLRPRNVAFSNKGPYAAIIMMRHYLSRIDPSNAICDRIEALLTEDQDFRDGVLWPNPK